MTTSSNDFKSINSSHWDIVARTVRFLGDAKKSNAMCCPTIPRFLDSVSKPHPFWMCGTPIFVVLTCRFKKQCHSIPSKTRQILESIFFFDVASIDDEQNFRETLLLNRVIISASVEYESDSDRTLYIDLKEPSSLSKLINKHHRTCFVRHELGTAEHNRWYTDTASNATDVYLGNWASEPTAVTLCFYQERFVEESTSIQTIRRHEQYQTSPR